MFEFLKPQSPLQHKDGAFFYPLTTADQVILDDNNRLNFALERLDEKQTEMNVLLDAKQKKHIAANVTLLASAWFNNQQTVTMSEANGTNTIIVCSSPENFNTYASDGVYCLSQGNGQLVFACASVPKVDLVANIMILN